MKTNETINTMLERQSCRKYLSNRIDPEIVDAIVTAGTYAPGSQPWTITVLTNPEKLARFGEMMTADLEAHMPGFKDGWIESPRGRVGPVLYGPDFAPMLVVVSEKPDPRSQRNRGIVSALACENMIIAAQSFGISSCWLGAVTENLIRPALSDPEGDPLLKSLVPEGNDLIGAIAFGYPAPDGFRTPRAERREDSVVYID